MKSGCKIFDTKVLDKTGKRYKYNFRNDSDVEASQFRKHKLVEDWTFQKYA